MSASIAELQRIALKLFVADASAVRLREVVPVFHSWIRSHAVDGLLIDVADYQHVPNGPGVLLIAREGNYGLDLGDGRLGMLYTRKTPLPGALPERLRMVARIVLRACHQLETDGSLGGRIRFRGEELQLIANDRLLAPNEASTRVAFEPALQALLAALYGTAACEIIVESDPRERFGVRVRAPEAVAVETLLQRLG